MAHTALVIRHVAHEGLAGLAAPVAAAGYAVRYVDMGRDRLDLAAMRAADLAIVMGGPMGVYEGDAHPWIAEEIAALRERIAAQRPTLGICLGAQMIAAALGAGVRAGPAKEVGFAPVTLSPAGAGSPLRHLAGVPLLHWHSDTFDLPDGAELLASSGRYRNQAFRLGDWLLATQFHPEMGEDAAIGQWLDGADAYLAAGGTSPAALLADYRTLGPSAVASGRAAVAEWLAAAA